MFEVEFKVNGRLVKKIGLSYHKNLCTVEVTELREDKLGKALAWYPVFMKTHARFYDARLEFMGLINEASYENANNTADTTRENIFVRGSFAVVRPNRNGHIK